MGKRGEKGRVRKSWEDREKETNRPERETEISGSGIEAGRLKGGRKIKEEERGNREGEVEKKGGSGRETLRKGGDESKRERVQERASMRMRETGKRG